MVCSLEERRERVRRLLYEWGSANLQRRPGPSGISVGETVIKIQRAKNPYQEKQEGCARLSNPKEDKARRILHPRQVQTNEHAADTAAQT